MKGFLLPPRQGLDTADGLLAVALMTDLDRLLALTATHPLARTTRLVHGYAILPEGVPCLQYVFTMAGGSVATFSIVTKDVGPLKTYSLAKAVEVYDVTTGIFVDLDGVEAFEAWLNKVAK